MAELRVALVQHDIVWEDRDATLAHLEPMVAEAAEGGGLVLLTELFAVGFTMNTEHVAEPIEGPTSVWMHDQASRRGVWIGGSVPIRHPAATRPSNTFVLFAPDGRTYRYGKVHTFTYGEEDEHYDAGQRTVTVDVDGVAVTPFVCYDLRFADQWWERAERTDLFVCVASWPAARGAHWQTLLRARAIENLAYVAGANRVGSGGGIDYTGDSMIVAPFGEVMADGTGRGETTVSATIDTKVVAARRDEFPFLADR